MIWVSLSRKNINFMSLVIFKAWIGRKSNRKSLRRGACVIDGEGEVSIYRCSFSIDTKKNISLQENLSSWGINSYQKTEQMQTTCSFRKCANDKKN